MGGPTVFAFFATSQAEVDQDPDSGEALADFQHYLSGVQRELERRGVQFHEFYGDSLVVVREGTAELFRLRTHTSAVGYVFYGPGKAARIFYGVMTDAELLDAAREYFGWPPPRPPV